MLEDIASACSIVAKATADITEADYVADVLLRLAVERAFEIMGEALVRLERIDPDTARRISDYRAVIGLRNRLIHGYDRVNNARVWEIIRGFLPTLQREVGDLLREAETEATDEPYRR